MNNELEVRDAGFVTPQWVKRHFAISNSTLYLWISKGYLPKPHKIGPRAVRFLRDDIKRFEDKLKTGE